VRESSIRSRSIKLLTSLYRRFPRQTLNRSLFPPMDCSDLDLKCLHTMWLPGNTSTIYNDLATIFETSSRTPPQNLTTITTTVRSTTIQNPIPSSFNNFSFIRRNSSPSIFELKPTDFIELEKLKIIIIPPISPPPPPPLAPTP
jgi:hypothetical protein